MCTICLACAWSASAATWFSGAMSPSFAASSRSSSRWRGTCGCWSPPGAAILDAPCGTGRYFPIVLGAGRFQMGSPEHERKLALAAGTPVVAPADGTVAQAGWQNGYGNLVVVDHGNEGFATRDRITASTARANSTPRAVKE